MIPASNYQMNITFTESSPFLSKTTSTSPTHNGMRYFDGSLESNNFATSSCNFLEKRELKNSLHQRKKKSSMGIAIDIRFVYS